MLCHIDVQVILMLVRFLCLLSLSMLVPSFVKLSMALDSVAFCFLLHVFFFYTGLSSSFQNVSAAGLNLCVWCCWCCWCRRPVVVVTVDRVFIFFGDGHGISQADSKFAMLDHSLCTGGGFAFWLLAVQFGGSCFP